MIYKYKAIHIPSQQVFEREVKQGHMYASGTRIVFGESSFAELLSYWNYQASLQTPIVWMYAKVINCMPAEYNLPVGFDCDQIGQDPSELERVDPID